MCVYIFTSMHMYMCVFIMYIHFFFFRELLAKHLPAHTVSNLPATPGHSPGPGLGDTGRLSLSFLHFPKLQSSEMWKEAPPAPLPHAFVLHFIQEDSPVHFPSHPSWLKPQFPDGSPEQSITEPWKFYSRAWH